MDEHANHQHRAYMPLSSEPDAEAPAVAINIRQHRQQARFGSPTAYPANDRRSRSVGSGSSAQPTTRGQLIGNLPQARNVKLPNLLPNTLLPSQKPVQLRQKDKLVLLPRGSSADVAADEAADLRPFPIQQQQQHPALDGLSSTEAAQVQPTSSLFEDLAEIAVVPDSRGRITVYCIAESLDRQKLEALIPAKYPLAQVTTDYTEVLHMSLPTDAGSDDADAFFFDYGVVCFWGMSLKQEQDILSNVAKKAQQQPLPPREVEKDSFEYRYSSCSPPSMQNDTITISRHHARDHQVKLAICHALAQSTKLCVYEERVVELVLETKHLPQALALNGTVQVQSEDIARRIGQVFLQRSAVNLLSTVLDTPDFFWSVPDFLQVLYERACDYLELDTRVEVLNARFQVLQEMLDMLRDHINNSHIVRLDWVIIWLIVVEVVVGLLELLGLFGLFSKRK